MAEFAGDVEVKVTPDTSRFRRELETGAVGPATRAAERIGREMGRVIAQQISRGVTDGLSTLRTGTAGAAAGRQFGRSFASTANAEIKSAVKSVSVKVHADTKAARTEIDGFAKAAGETLAKQVADGLRDGATDGTRDIPKQAPKAGAEYGGEFARSLKARLEESLRNLPDVEIDADSSQADIAIREIRGQLEALRDKKIGVDISAGDALTRIRDIQRQLDDLGRGDVDIQVQLDAAAASSRLAAFSAQCERLERDGVDVDVDVDTGAALAGLAAMRAAAGGATSGMSGLVLAALALGPALVPIGAAGAAALGAVGVAALGAAGGVGVLVLALKPVITAMQALGKAQDAVGGSAGRAASQHLQMAGASDALAAAQAGLASAIQSAREQEERSAERVAEARRDLARTKADASRDEAAAARRVADAERSLADAQRDFLDAQEAVNEARREAARDLEDLSSQLANARLDEEAAQIRMIEAQERYAEVMADSTATALDRRRAELELMSAQQGLSDAQKDLVRLQSEANEAVKEGVDGSDRVVSAKEREREAAERVGDAQRGVAEAQEDAEDRRRRSDERVADAQRALARAVQDAAIQQRKSAEQVAAAQRQVESAQRGVERASLSAGAAGGGAMSEVQQAMAKLTPEGRAFVAFLRGEFLPAFAGLSGVAQRGVLPGLQDAMQAVMSLAPLVTSMVESLSQAMGQLFREAGQALAGPFWRDFFEFLAATAGPALLTFGRTVGALVEGFAGLFQAFAPVGLAVGDALLALAQRFAEFGRTASTNDGFQRFLAYVQDVGPLVARTIGALIGAVVNIIRALAPMGPLVLGIIEGVASFLSIIPPGVLQAVALGFVLIFGGLKALAVIVPVVSAAVGVLNGTLALNPIVLVVVAIAALVAALVVAYQRSETFREIVDKAWAGIKTAVVTAWEKYIQPALKAFWRFLTETLAPALISFYFDYLHPTFVRAYTIIRFAWQEVIKPALRELWKFLTETLAPALVWLWHNVVKPVWQGISVAIDIAWAAIKLILGAIKFYISEVLAPVFRWLWNNVIKPVWAGIQIAIDVAWAVIKLIFGAIRFYIREVLAPVFRWLWNNIIKPVWDGISNTISTVWTKFIKPVFVALGNFIEQNVAPAFRRGVDAISRAWDRVKEVAKVPVRFMVDTVINKGIIGAYNKLAGWFGVDPVEQVKLPEGFATGGLLRGPGSGTSDSILARVSNGEYVIRADVVRRLGVDFFDALNRSGTIGGDIKSALAAPRFATGGLVQRVLDWLPSVDPLPYVWGAVGPNAYDCSGLTGEVYNRLTDRPSFRRSFTTSSDFRALGFRPGQGMFTLGLTPGQHVTGRLGALPFEAQSTATGIFVGNRATPVSAMAQQWYLPSVGPGGGDAPGGFDFLHPIASVQRLLRAPLARLSEIESSPFGRLVATAPRRLADAAIGKLTGALDGLPGFARGGLMAYDSGGWLPQGISTVVNATGRPEPVLTPGQWDALAGSGGRGLEVTFNVTNPAPETLSETLTRGGRRLAAHGLIG